MNYTFYAFLEDYPNIDFFSTPDYIKNGFELVLKVDLRLIYDNIKQKYHDAGMKSFGIPYNPPHILFWNLRSTSGFPNLSTEKNHI